MVLQIMMARVRTTLGIRHAFPRDFIMQGVRFNEKYLSLKDF